MGLGHKLVLYSLLGFVGVTLVIPGFIEMFKYQPGGAGLLPSTLEAKNQFRALNAMMTGLGAMALWACADLERSRTLVIALGTVLLLVALARIYSVIVDGLPGVTMRVYTAAELLLAAVFLIWPPGE